MVSSDYAGADVNDADFELLARDAAARVIEHGWKPQTLETDTWLRMRALELAVDAARLAAPLGTADAVVFIQHAGLIFKFLKGDDGVQDLHGTKQDER
jgi:hypothetical protein